MSPAYLSIIGGDFVLESVVWYSALVRYLEFGGCPLFRSRKCIVSTGIAVGASSVVRYLEVCYWELPLYILPILGYLTIKLGIYSETCANDHLCPETTYLKRPLLMVPNNILINFIQCYLLSADTSI